MAEKSKDFYARRLLHFTSEALFCQKVTGKAVKRGTEVLNGKLPRCTVEPRFTEPRFE